MYMLSISAYIILYFLTDEWDEAAYHNQYQ
jgi:hypothetical protein